MVHEDRESFPMVTQALQCLPLGWMQRLIGKFLFPHSRHGGGGIAQRLVIYPKALLTLTVVP